MTTRPCGLRNLYYFLHRLSAVPPFLHRFASFCSSETRWGLYKIPARQVRTITAILFPLGAATVINAADIITRIPQPEYFSFYFSCIRRIPAEKKHTPTQTAPQEKAQQSHLSRTTTCTSSGQDSRCLQSIPRHDKDTTGSGQECKPRNRHSSA